MTGKKCSHCILLPSCVTLARTDTVLGLISVGHRIIQTFLFFSFLFSLISDEYYTILIQTLFSVIW